MNAGDDSAAKAEREKLLRRLLDLYRPKQRLRTRDRSLIKTIKSLQQGFDGTRGRCCRCGKEDDVDLSLQVHHLDGVESHNDLANLELAHPKCNNLERHHPTAGLSKLGVREKTTAKPDCTPFEWCSWWSSKEGEKHDVMRQKWDVWIRDLKGGPFRAVHASIRVSALAAMAVHRLGMGSSVTYRRYIEEDAAGGVFRFFHDGGLLFVEYLGGGRKID